MEKVSETSEMEMIDSSFVSPVSSPGFAGIEEGVEDHCAIIFQFCRKADDSSPLPDATPESPKSAACL